MDWMNEYLEEEAAKRRAEAEAEDQRIMNSPEYRAKLAAARQAEFERGVRLGWWDKDGEPICRIDDEDEEETEE